MPANEPAPSKKLVKKSGSRRDRKRATLVRFLLTTVVTTTMIATGGFGTFPPNELTAKSANLISQNFPAEIIRPVNLVLEQAAAPTLEIVEHPQAADAGAELAKMFENLIEPVFTPPPEASTEAAASTPESLVTITAESGTPTAESSSIPTIEAMLTATEALSLTPTLIVQPTKTIEPSSTPTLAPTWTVVYLPPPPTNTKKPKPPTDTAIPPTITISPSPTSVPAGHTISSLNLNSSGTNIISVSGGSSVSVDYTYQVWGNSTACPGCDFELVWGLDNAWQSCYAWTSPSPGDYPGQTGTALADGINFTLTAPATAGTYTIYALSGQYTNCTAAIAAYTSASGTSVGTITVLPPPTPNPCIVSGPVSVSGEQWYYGQTSCSCNSVCAATGVNTTAFNAVDWTKCQSVFDAVFGTGTYSVANWAGLGNGIGCHFDTAAPAAAWYNDAVDPSTALPQVNRMCVCNP